MALDWLPPWTQVGPTVDDLIVRPGGILRHREWGL
jgi:hypothetical protein